MAHGKPRHPLAVVLLMAVTMIFAFGAYWFYWLARAFQEVGDDRGKKLGAAPWLFALVPLWSIAFILNTTSGIKEYLARRGDPAPTSLADVIGGAAPDYSSPLVYVPLVLTAVLYIVQLAYLRKIHDFIAETMAAPPLPGPPAFGFVLAFTSLNLLAAIPFAGIMLGLAGTGLAIAWVVLMQQTLNRYWAARAPPAAAPPMPYGTLAPMPR